MKLAPSLVFLLSLQCVFPQIQDRLDFVHAAVLIEPVVTEKAILGQVRYRFQVVGNVDSLFLDAHNMEFSAVLLDGGAVAHRVGPEKIIIAHGFKKGGSHELLLQYRARPEQTVYFLGEGAMDPSLAQVWTQGQGDRKSTRLNYSHVNIPYAVFSLKESGYVLL